MCYGDINHGNDGYYHDYLEEIERESQIERQLSEEAEINYYRNKDYLITSDDNEIPF